MCKLIMLSGLPASGKSTRAKEIVDQGGWVRVNRDLLRTMLHFDKWSGPNEGLTVGAEKFMVEGFLKAGKNVVVDDANLNPNNKIMWMNIAKECGASFEHQFIGQEASVEDLVYRDSQRENPVGGTVIKNMALQYGIQPQPFKGYIICDIDGTIADCEHRRHYVDKFPKDWKGFFSEMHKDPLRKDVAKKVIDYYNKMHTIIYVSARPEEYRDVTLEWLKKHSMSFGWTLIMRSSGDRRPDIEVKQEIYNKYLKNYPIEAVFDDRPSVIEMWKGNGLKVIDVGDGEEF